MCQSRLTESSMNNYLVNDNYPNSVCQSGTKQGIWPWYFLEYACNICCQGFIKFYEGLTKILMFEKLFLVVLYQKNLQSSFISVIFQRFALYTWHHEKKKLHKELTKVIDVWITWNKMVTYHLQNVELMLQARFVFDLPF